MPVSALGLKQPLRVVLAVNCLESAFSLSYAAGYHRNHAHRSGFSTFSVLATNVAAGTFKAPANNKTVANAG